MSIKIHKNLTKVPARLTIPTCLGCGAMERFRTCENGCREYRLDLIRAADYDEIVTARRNARGRIDASRALVEEFVSRQPTAAQYESAWRSVQDQARTILHRFPDRLLYEKVVEGPPPPTATSWCADCDGVDAPQQCLEFCIWRSVEWVNYTSYRQQRMLAVSECLIDARLHNLLRRIASITPLAGGWAPSWRALQAEARTTLEAVDSGRSQAICNGVAALPGLKNGGDRRVLTDAAGHRESDDEYERGREEGMVWAREFAPIKILGDLVEKPETMVDDFKAPHWRGFVTGAEQVWDVIVAPNGRQASLLGERLARSAC